MQHGRRRLPHGKAARAVQMLIAKLSHVQKQTAAILYRSGFWGWCGMRKIAYVAAVAVIVSGCVTTDRARFTLGPGQSELIRDGRPAVSSVGKNTLALVRTRNRDLQQRARVPFVVAFQNRSSAPLNFNVRDVEVIQTIPNRGDQPIEVLTFEKLQQEERTRQVVGAILMVAAAGANAAAASQAGNFRTNTTIHTPRGTFYGTTTGYSPALAAAASANAAAQNSMMINQAVEQGQANMARLENEYIKDHTVLPGEWYGGVLTIEPPLSGDPAVPTTYNMSIRIGSDVHKFQISQEPNKS